VTSDGFLQHAAKHGIDVVLSSDMTTLLIHVLSVNTVELLTDSGKCVIPSSKEESETNGHFTQKVKCNTAIMSSNNIRLPSLFDPSVKFNSTVNLIREGD
jgi:hypothetical protein